MNGVKIIFFDIDSALIDMQKKRISERMLETLKRRRSAESESAWLRADEGVWHYCREHGLI